MYKIQVSILLYSWENIKGFDASVATQNVLCIRHSRTQSLLKGPPWLIPEDNFQTLRLQMPGVCYF